MVEVDFRHRASEALSRAKEALAVSDPHRLRYAALELRMAIEAVTYERAQIYKEELPAEVYRTWQPKKLMEQLLDLEPLADKGGSLAYGVEKVTGVPPSEMHYLGFEQVFGMRDIKKHYDALGSFLHTPTLKQLEEEGDADFVKLQERCTTLVSLLDGVLSSTVFNINFGVYTSIECMNSDCKKPIRRRVRSGAELIATECRECGFQYEIRPQANEMWLWEPVLEKIPCPVDGCSEVFKLSPKQLVPGTRLFCTACQRRFLIGLAVFDGKELQDHEKDAHD